jgi:biotin carboxyl carrier protein
VTVTPTARLYLLFLVGTLAPFFFPAARDKAEEVVAASGIEVLLDAARFDAAPASVAILRQARADFTELTSTGDLTVKVNGTQVTTSEGVTPSLEDISLNGGCTLSAAEVEAVLVQYDSPAAGIGLGEHSVNECQRTGIDNAFWLAMAIHEGSITAPPQWAGNKGNGNYTANTGNIVCAGYPSCYGRFRDFNNDWKLGTTQHIELLRCYRDGGGEGCEGLWTGKAHATIVEAVNTWAPPIENDTNTYANYVVEQAKEWRLAKLNTATEALKPADAVKSENCQAEPWPQAKDGVNWQYGYHAGAFDWVAPEATKVYAPVCGTFVSQGAYYDDEKYGAYVIILTDRGLEVYLGHLDHETVNPLGLQPGQRIEAGQQIGQLSEFPYSAPHSHIQLRRNGGLVSADTWWTEWDAR